MSITKKFIIHFCFATITTLILYFAILLLVIDRKFNEFSEKSAEMNLFRNNQIVGFIENELLKNVRDYAVWDEMYEYASTNDEKWVDKNVTKWIPKNYDIDLILITDKEGKLLYRYGNFKGFEIGMNLLEKSENPVSGLIKSGLSNKERTGIIIIDGKMIDVAASPILHSDSSGPVNGVYLHGKLINNSFAEDIKKLLQNDVAIYLGDNIVAITKECGKTKRNNHHGNLRSPDNLEKIENFYKMMDSVIYQNLLKGNKKNHIEKFGQNELLLYAPLRDVENNIIGMFKITTSVKIFNETKNNILYVSSLLLLISFLFSSLVALFTSRSIIAPLSKLHNAINKISATGDTENEINISSKDEIGQLASAFNIMMRSLNNRTSALATANEHLKNANKQLNLTLKELKSEKDFSLRIIDNARFFILGIGTDNQILLYNRTAEEITGYSKEEIKENWIDTLKIKKEHSVILKDAIQKAFKEQTIRDIELTIIRKDGQEKILLMDAIYMQGIDSNDSCVMLIGTDITDKKMMEQRLIHTSKMEAIGTLAGGIIHDFNNLLSGILGYSSLAKSNLPKSEDIKNRNIHRYIDTIHETAERGAELTGQLLSFSRKSRSKIETINPHDSVRNIIKLLGRTLDKNIAFEVKMEEPISNIEADKSQFETVIMNLALNARDSMPNGGTLKIETKNVELDESFCKGKENLIPGKYFYIAIHDTGVGIPEENKNKIFEPFFTTKEQGKGTGLGLSLVNEIIKENNGYITFKSEIGKGTTFEVYWRTSHKTYSVEMEKPVRIKRGSEKILVVDDEKVIQDLIYDILALNGYQVDIAEDGESALSIFEEKKPDVVILDMQMPVLDGLETYKKLKGINPSCKVIIISGYAENNKVREVMNLGANLLIKKPFKIDDILTVVRQVLDER